MNIKDAVEKLNALTDDDPELDHLEAEKIVCEYLRSCGGEEVANAFLKARERVGFWYA